MEYKVTSKIVELKQKVRAITKQHDLKYPRTVEWLKDSESEDYFTLEEAEILKEYLDGKENFKDNAVCEISEDDESSVIGLAITSKKIYDKKVSVDEPIEIGQCQDLADYNLTFGTIGYLNENELK